MRSIQFGRLIHTSHVMAFYITFLNSEQWDLLTLRDMRLLLLSIYALYQLPHTKNTRTHFYRTVNVLTFVHVKRNDMLMRHDYLPYFSEHSLTFDTFKSSTFSTQ